MANVDAPFGFRQVGGLGSRPTSEGTSKYVIKTGYAGVIYAGDVVEFGAGTGEGGNAIAAGYVGEAAETSSYVMWVFSMVVFTTIQQLVNQRLKTTGREVSQ